MIVFRHHGFIDRVCRERGDRSRIRNESAIAFTAESDRDSGCFLVVAYHVSRRYSRLLQRPETKISEMIAAHLAEERNLVTELSHPGSEDRGSTTERQLTFLREDLGTHQRPRPKTRRYDVDIQLTGDENLRSL